MGPQEREPPSWAYTAGAPHGGVVKRRGEDVARQKQVGATGEFVRRCMAGEAAAAGDGLMGLHSGRATRRSSEHDDGRTRRGRHKRQEPQRSCLGAGRVGPLQPEPASLDYIAGVTSGGVVNWR